MSTEQEIKKITFTPNAKQEAFFCARTKYTAYGGARGGGKSWAMRMKLILLALRYDGISILLLRRTLGELRENHLLPMRRLLDGIAVYRDSGKEFLFQNGSRIKLGYCDSESDVLIYQGQAYEVIGMEEATHFTYYQFLCLTECNRINGNMKEKFTPRMYFTCNPGGVGHEWVKRLFVDRIYTENENPNDYTFVRSLVYDNDFLMKNDPTYVKALEALPEKRKQAMLYGDWNAFEGAFFPEFNTKFHVTDETTPPPGCIKFRALDYGLDMTACLWVAVLPDGGLFVYREFCEKDLILSAAARKILAHTLPSENIRYTVASPDLWNRRQDSGKSGFEIMTESGLRKMIKADNARVPGWRTLREYLNCSSGKPKLIISAECTNLIRCLPALRFDEKVPEDAAGTPHDITHSPEALRYAVMSRSPKLPPDNSYFPSVFSFPPFKAERKESFEGFIDY